MPGGSVSTANRYRYIYGVGSYEALILWTATYQGWTGSWNSTLAHNLTGITYDPSGNITALRCYRQDETLIDDLSYGYPSGSTGSNRLSSVTEQVTGNSETWNARSGLFT